MHNHYLCIQYSPFLARNGQFSVQAEVGTHRKKSMKMSKKRKICLLSATLFLTWGVHAQDFAVKTNFLSEATLNANAGVEIGLAPKWSLDATAQVNFWTVDDHRWKHWLVQPEARYWFCERFAGHFVGVHAIGGEYNIGNIRNDIRFLGTDFSLLSDRRYQGWGVGAGVAYGYAWVLNEHWNIEAEIGAGWIYTRYDVFPCAECGTRLETDSHHNYFGPTKAALSLVYLF